MPTARNPILEKVRTEWGDDTLTYRVALCLANDLRAGAASLLTPDMVCRICHIDQYDSDDVATALFALSSKRLAMLQVRVAVYDTLQTPYFLTQKQVGDYVRGRTVISPVTGDPLPLHGEGAPFLYFAATDQFERLLKQP